MAEATVIIVGPGGVGKSPLEPLFKKEVDRMDPNRLRRKGPRDSGDIYYANKRLKDEIEAILGDKNRKEVRTKNKKAEETILWYPENKVLLFTVRQEEWQVLFFSPFRGPLAKAEIYAPVLVAILEAEELSELRELLGKMHICILNPSSMKLSAGKKCYKDIQKKTEENCKQRGDSVKSITTRVDSVLVEAPAWAGLLSYPGAVEYFGWKYPEYKYKVGDVTQEIGKLIKARDCLLGKRRAKRLLSQFFKNDYEIAQSVIHSEYERLVAGNKRIEKFLKREKEVLKSVVKELGITVPAMRPPAP